MKIHDKVFESYISETEINEHVTRLACAISQQFSDKNPLFIAVLNGSFMFASDILKQLNFPAQISFVKLASYLGTKSLGAISELIGVNEPLRDRNIVILEDIVDSGLTMEKLTAYLYSQGAASVVIVTMLFKPKSFKANIKIDFIGIEIPDYFVVGYGMDYNGYGRNIREILKIAE